MLSFVNACIGTHMQFRVSYIRTWASDAFCDLLDRFVWYVFRLGRSVAMSVYISARVVICNAFILERMHWHTHAFQYEMVRSDVIAASDAYSDRRKRFLRYDIV